MQVKPELLRWAYDRSRVPALRLRHRFPKLAAWERGDEQPTVKQLEAFAGATHVPFGFLFLPEAPDEPLPLADFRERPPGPPSGEGTTTARAAGMFTIDRSARSWGLPERVTTRRSFARSPRWRAISSSISTLSRSARTTRAWPRSEGEREGEGERQGEGAAELPG